MHSDFKERDVVITDAEGRILWQKRIVVPCEGDPTGAVITALLQEISELKAQAKESPSI